MPIALTAIVGAMIGSFLNVVAYRLPRSKSLVAPGSQCPGCDTPIKAYDNVPVLGWLLLRGRCRTCGTAISPRYPAVEALTAALAVAVIIVEHSTVDKVLGLVLVGILVPIALIDLDHQIIPNKITAPAAILAVAIGLALKPAGVPEQLIAGAGAGLSCWCSCSHIRAGWGWATSSSPGCSACSSDARWESRSSSP